MKEVHICFLSAHLPDSRAKEAGQRTAYDHLRKMAADYQISLIAFANGRELKDIDQSLYALCDAVTIIPVSTWSRIARIVQQLHLPVFIACRVTSKVHEAIAVLRKQHNNIVFWLEYVQMAHYITKLKSIHDRWIVSCHDIATQMFERRSEQCRGIQCLFYQIEAKRLRRWESKCLRLADYVLVPSEKDRDLALRLGARYVSVAPPPVGKLCKARTSIASDIPTIVFFGAMNRMENEDAVMWFITSMFPAIKTSIHNVKLIILGANPSCRLTELAQQFEGITVTGYVENPSTYFEQAWISVVPLRMGAGVKVKVLECLAQGMPVVATSVGSEGIDAKEEHGLFTCDVPEEFIDQCILLLKNRAQCEEFSSKSREWFLNFVQLNEFTKERICSIICNVPANTNQT